MRPRGGRKRYPGLRQAQWMCCAPWGGAERAEKQSLPHGLALLPRIDGQAVTERNCSTKPIRASGGSSFPGEICAFPYHQKNWARHDVAVAPPHDPKACCFRGILPVLPASALAQEKLAPMLSPMLRIETGDAHVGRQAHRGRSQLHAYGLGVRRQDRTAVEPASARRTPAPAHDAGPDRQWRSRQGVRRCHRPRRKLVAAGGATGDNNQYWIFLFDAGSGRVVARLGPAKSVNNHVVFSHDGRYVAAALGSGPALWRGSARGLPHGARCFSIRILTERTVTARLRAGRTPVRGRR